MTRLVIELGDIEISDKAREALLSDLRRSAITHLAQLRLAEAVLSFSLPKNFWGLMLHGASRGCHAAPDDPPRR